MILTVPRSLPFLVQLSSQIPDVKETLLCVVIRRLKDPVRLRYLVPTWTSLLLSVVGNLALK